MMATYDDYGYYSGEEHNTGCLRFFRALLMGMNVLLTAGAIAGLSVALLERSTMEATLNDLCPSCHTAFIAYVAAFSVLLAFSILGFFALCTRNAVLRGLYFIYLFVVFLGAFSICIVYVLVSTNQINMETGWNKAAVNRAEAMCTLELKFRCSGWKALCNTSNTNAVVVIGPHEELHSTATGDKQMHMTSDIVQLGKVFHSSDPVICPVCSAEDQKQINEYTTTCDSVVMDSIKEHTKEVLPIGLSITGIAVLGMMVTCLLQRETRRDEYYSGRYYRV